MAHNYILRVTAGPSYETDTHKVVNVNTAEPLHIESDLVDVDVNVRVQDYYGLPRGSPTTSPYFSLPPHNTNKDQYSIGFRFTPKSSISADDLVFGNDFEHPIRDRLPPGFGTAMKIVKWGIDPGLDGDVYADRPYLYGPLASSINTLNIGGIDGKGDSVEIDKEAGIVVKEGGEGDGTELRSEKGVPESEAARKKWFLTESNRKTFTFEKGRSVGCDFFNAYLDFNEFALRLPGFSLHLMSFWDGQGLRYVLKNRKTGDVLFVVLFTLFLKQDVNEDGSIKEGVEERVGKPFTKGEGDEVNAEGRKRQEKEDESMRTVVDDGTTEDDVD